MMHARRAWPAIVFFLAACGAEAPEPTFHAAENPEALSAWGMVSVRNSRLTLAEDVAPYDLATPLFSDYAQKLRTVWMPEGQAARYDAEDVFDFPVGTVITKTFYYETGDDAGLVKAASARDFSDGALALGGVRLIETRILARREDGWAALPYVWNADGTEARLQRTGAVIPLTLERADGRREDFAYLVPNQNQCAGCHATDATTRAIEPIGPKARHLNKMSSFHAGFNQLDWWAATERLVVAAEEAHHAPRNAAWGDKAFSLDARARAYLDVNCAHCHSNSGPADTSGLDLRPATPLGPAYGLCKAPIAAGSGSGGRPYDIVPGAPEKSITLFRMETNDPAAMMPELGRAVVHEEGAALIRDWIAAMDGACG